MKFIQGLLQRESGQDMVEYALLAAFISITAVATLRVIGPLVVAVWEQIQAVIESA